MCLTTSSVQMSIMFSVQLQCSSTGRRCAGKEPDAGGWIMSLVITFSHRTEIYSELVNLVDIQLQLTRISHSPLYADVLQILISLIIAELSGN